MAFALFKSKSKETNCIPTNLIVIPCGPRKVEKPVVKKMSFLSLFRKKNITSIVPVANNLADLEYMLSQTKEEFEELLKEYNNRKRTFSKKRFCEPPKESYPELDEIEELYISLCFTSDRIFELKKKIIALNA